MKLILEKRDNGLFPVYQKDHDNYNKLGKGQLIADIRKPRNINHHRKFFALLNCVFENQDKYKDVETLRKVVMVAIGACDMCKGTKDEWIAIPKSMNFESMDQVEFSDQVYTPAVVKFAEFLGCTVAELEQNKNEYY